MINLPKISIITPTYNSESNIETCIRSIENQTYKNVEHLIIDGASKDNTVSFIDKYATEYSHLKFISEADNGIYDAMNKGIDIATGEWIYFLGSDDELYNPQVLENVFTKVNSSKYSVIYGNVKYKHSGIIYDGEFSNYKLLHKNICHQSMFIKKKLLVSVGKFYVEYTELADWVFNMIWFPNKKIERKYLDLVIAIYNEQGKSSSEVDGHFYKNKDWIIKKHFPLKDRLRYYLGIL